MAKMSLLEGKVQLYAPDYYIEMFNGDDRLVYNYSGFIIDYAGDIEEEDFSSQRYTELMRKSYRENRSEWDKLLAREKVVLVCFCPSGAFCHRVLLAEMLEKLGGKYMGEIKE